MQGQIFKIFSDLYYVNYNNETFVCKIREVLKKQKNVVVTGDYVEFENGVINNILPRSSYIKRPAVANVDQIVVVSALKSPELNFNQLNRYISLAKYYKIPVVLCFNKEDLGVEDGLQDRIEKIYANLGYQICYTSALEKIGIDDFARLLEGKLSALCGNSGVGKSSLVNALNPDIHLKTKSVSEKSQRGTHTTRHCEIVAVNNSTFVIDTPGFSNMKFDFLLPKDVDLLFDEIAQYKNMCKFSDCLHINESGCEVLKHLEEIDISRYQSYSEFVKEAFEFKEKVKFNGLKEETFKKFHNNKAVVKISDKKRTAARNTQKQAIYKDFEDEHE